MRSALLRSGLLLLAALSFAQQGSSSEVFAPFVSRLKAEASEDSVVLSWRKSSDVDGAYLVYRSAKEITEQSFAEAEFLARVDAGTESYTDYPPYGLAAYYAVLIEGADRKLYPIFIPFRNKTTGAVSVRPPAPSEEAAAEITGIAASPRAEAVAVSFSASKADRDLMLFRSTRPIRRVEDLVESSSVVPLKAGTTLYEDRAIPGVDYYYCVVDARLLTSGQAPIVQGQNSLAKPVRVPLSAALQSNVARSRPLPRLMIPAGVEFGDELIPSPPFLLPRERELAPATAKAVARLRASIRPSARAPMAPAVLEEDTSSQARGEEAILAAIVQESFAVRNYADAEDRITRFLRIDRSAKVEARASFYLGQIRYLRGDARGAFLAFLLALDRYYEQAQPWLDACFAELGQT
jgi:hypothetical protein